MRGPDSQGRDLGEPGFRSTLYAPPIRNARDASSGLSHAIEVPIPLHRDSPNLLAFEPADLSVISSTYPHWNSCVSRLCVADCWKAPGDRQEACAIVVLKRIAKRSLSTGRRARGASGAVVASAAGCRTAVRRARISCCYTSHDPDRTGSGATNGSRHCEALGMLPVGHGPAAAA